jgi:glycosyltransferase involved in cell wall biosynthesis
MSTRFTVIIPTRERVETLKYSIASCVAQQYENMQIIVSDNASQDATRDVVHSFEDPRIRYVNPGRRVSMVENFEFAFSHVHDGYVVSFGDDDALARDALIKADRLIKETRSQAIVSDFAQYVWPNIATMAANQLMFSPRQGYEIRSSREFLDKVLYRRHPFNHLPCIYYGFIDCNLINRLRSGQGGKLFMTSVVDVYTAIALATHIESYCFSLEPLTINGTSGRSNGASFMRISKDESEKKRWYEENTLTRQPPFYASGGIKMLLAEAFYALQNACPDGRFKDSVDYTRLLQQAIDDIGLYPKFGFDLDQILKLIHDFGVQAERPTLWSRLRAKYHLYEDRAPKFLKAVMVNAADYDARDVDAAAVLMQKLQLKQSPWLSSAKFPMLAKRFLAVR